MNIYFLSGKEFDDAGRAGANFHHVEGGLESCQDLGLDPLGQPPGGRSGASRPHDACQPR